MKPKQISREEWMEFCDKLTPSQSVMELAKKNEALLDAYMGREEIFDFLEWTGAKQGQPTKEEVMQGEIDRLGRVIRKLELELSEARFDKAMLVAELNARRKK